MIIGIFSQFGVASVQGVVAPPSLPATSTCVDVRLFWPPSRSVCSGEVVG